MGMTRKMEQMKVSGLETEIMVPDWEDEWETEILEERPPETEAVTEPAKENSGYSDPPKPFDCMIFESILIAFFLTGILAAAGAYIKRKRKNNQKKRTSVGKTESNEPGIRVGKVHDTGKRESQQDSFGVSKMGTEIPTAGKGVLAVVADGMGGLSGGGEISVLATMTMMRAFEQMGEEAGDIQLLRMMNLANEEVNRLLCQKKGSEGGTTLASVIIREDMLYWLSVGDSRIYLYRGGSLFQVSRDHTYGVMLDEKAARGEISREAAARDPQRRALTSYIGMKKIEKTDRNVRPVRLQEGDRILLMSDGVFGALTEEEICLAMRCPVEQSSEEIGRMIRIKDYPYQDNYTALILEYTEEL